MAISIKSRLWDIGKKQVDLIPELAKNGIKALPSDITNAIQGIIISPKYRNMRINIEYITHEWEKEYAKSHKVK